MNALVKLEQAHALLAEVRTIPEAKKLMDMADAAKFYARKMKLGEESELYAHAIKIDAHTILGMFAKQVPRAKRQRWEFDLTVAVRDD